jgi:hypothetical protein
LRSRAGPLPVQEIRAVDGHQLAKRRLVSTFLADWCMEETQWTRLS